MNWTSERTSYSTLGGSYWPYDSTWGRSDPKFSNRSLGRCTNEEQCLGSISTAEVSANFTSLPGRPYNQFIDSTEQGSPYLVPIAVVLTPVHHPKQGKPFRP